MARRSPVQLGHVRPISSRVAFDFGGYHLFATMARPLVVDALELLPEATSDRCLVSPGGVGFAVVDVVVILDPARWNYQPAGAILIRAELAPEIAADELAKKRAGRFHGAAGERTVPIHVSEGDTPGSRDPFDLYFAGGRPLFLIGRRFELRRVLEHRDLVVREVGWAEVSPPVFVIGAPSALVPVAPPTAA